MLFFELVIALAEILPWQVSVKTVTRRLGRGRQAERIRTPRQLAPTRNRLLQCKMDAIDNSNLVIDRSCDLSVGRKRGDILTAESE